MNAAACFPTPQPRLRPPLGGDFWPAVLARRAFEKGLDSIGQGLARAATIEIALERTAGAVSRFSTRVAPDGHPFEAANFQQVERWLKFLLWSRGGAKIWFSGPATILGALQRHYSETTIGRFDADIMGNKVYERPFEIVSVSPSDLPPTQEEAAPLGRHLNGCRIGFDLGASDRKVAAVQDGKVLFTEETPWNPRVESDPQWHFTQIMDSLKRAAEHLPRVDAIGGSSAGIYVNNRVQVASLFRGVPEPLFGTRIKGLFAELKRAWGGIPFEVVNDGEVTALAGAMSLNDSAVLGIAMGSSEAAGYVTPEGNITSWLNELAFAPVDYNPDAPRDEWSGDYGCGVQYFSQQAVGRLAPESGLEVDRRAGLPEQLVEVQHFMARGDERAVRIYETIGTYLGYGIAHYADFYDFRNLLLLGRVTTGSGGGVIVSRAREVLAAEFPELADRITIHLPDEKEKRHGQAVAAASLPAL
jgi:predicted NBD/HSP70 family sugar kinase